MSNVSDERLLGLCADLYSSQNPAATLDEGRAMALELAEMRKGWIPVLDRLPDKQTCVLVTVYLGAERVVTIGSRSGNTGEWRTDYRCTPQSVTHWRPLPPSPSTEAAR